MTTDTARRVIAITGAGGTLGAAISRQFASEPGTDLVLSDVSAPSLEGTVVGLPDNGATVESMLADVSDFDQVEAVVARAVERFGRLDVLVSNAGVLSANGRIHNLATEEWERAFRVNIMGAVNGIRAAVPVMRRQKSGSIVLIDAMAAKHPLGLGSATDLVGAYSYLASDASRWTTGLAMVVDGGYAAP
jgi:NAD(P)-dependent dehydrogenase (short-subunit alcohol dehydrogenase family)